MSATVDVSRLQTKLLINNQWVDAASGKKFDVYDPATGKVIVQVAEADAADVDLAVVAARAAFKKFRTTDPKYRRDLMLKLADLIEANREQIAAIETLDNGKPYLQALNVDVKQVVETFRYYAGWADKIYGQIAPVSGNNFSMVRREPLGVCGQIIPWNFPLLMAAWKLGPALAMGNAVVLKPAEQTPLSALRLGELIVEAGYPAGIVNILPGFGPTAGARLSSHPDVNKIAFTGSTEIGHVIMRAAANSNLKKVSLELGGKSALIILEDADLAQAAAATAAGIFFNQGQVCTASSRVFVHESVHEKFVELLKANAAKWKVARGQDADSDMGPLVSAEQHERVLGYIAKGKEEGAACVAGGARAHEHGYFVQPTVFTGVTDGMTIAKEEIFGPVLAVLTFKTHDEVIERANASVYGLAAGVFTNDVNNVFKFSSFLEAGTVWVNCWNFFDVAQPFGGFKMSGIGRELGEQALALYTEVKTVCVALNGPIVK